MRIRSNPMGKLKGTLSQYWNRIQGTLFPWPGQMQLEQLFEIISV